MICQVRAGELGVKIKQLARCLDGLAIDCRSTDRFINKLPEHVLNVTDYVVLKESDLKKEAWITPLIQLVYPKFKDVSIVRVPAHRMGYIHRDPSRKIALDIAFSRGSERAYHVMYGSGKNGYDTHVLGRYSFDLGFALIYDAQVYHQIDNLQDNDLLYLSFSYDGPSVYAIAANAEQQQ